MASSAVVVLAVFLAGITFGVIMLVAAAIRREDRRYSPEKQAGSARGAPAAARRLVSFGQRAYPASRRHALGSAAD
jgi:hypothetical protein